jgi:hypothetical protein
MQRPWPSRFPTPSASRRRRILLVVFTLAACGYVDARANRGGGELGEASAVRPRLGRTVVVEPVSGEVFVRTPNGPRILLSARRPIPVRSIVDTRRGKVRLTSARVKRGRTQSGVFSQGRFEVRQSRKRNARGLTVLRLRAGLGCRRAQSAGAGRAEASRGKRHKLTGDADGNFRTRSNKGAGTARGTVWDTIDTCKATRFVVRRGKLDVARVTTSGRILINTSVRLRARGRRHAATIRG